jgi:folate-binding protein YgfZ
MIALSNLSAIRFSSTDAGDFLHNQLSADVLGLSNGETTFACYCEPKGRVLALMLVCRADEDYYVIMSSSLVMAVIKRLKIYVMRSKVLIEVLNGYQVFGHQSEVVPEPPSIPISVKPLPDSKRWYLVSSDDISPDKIGPGRDGWKIAELQQGITWLCPETSGKFLPQMLGFDQLGAVNFRKGCYPGQEIVARTHYLGKVKRHPRLLCSSEIINVNPMDKIQIFSQGQPYQAIITDSGQRVDGGRCLFAVTRMDPELSAEKIEYQGRISALSDS